MNAYTTADLLVAVRNVGMLPDASSGSLSPDNLLRYATDELHSLIVPLIMSVREHYYERYTDVTSASGVATYSIPERAVGGVLSSLQYSINGGLCPLDPIPASMAATESPSLTPVGYWFQGNSVVLHPPPSSTPYTLRMRYFQRPSRLELTSACAQISAIDTVNNSVTVSSIPSSWTTGTSLDFIPKSIPNTPYEMDKATTGVTGTTISFSSLPSGVVIGDWLAIAGYTPIPELPFEMFPAIVQATVCKALESIGDAQGLGAAKESLQGKLQAAIKLITPRNQTGNKKVVSGWRFL